MWLAVQNAVSWKKLVKSDGGASLKADTLVKEVIKCIVCSCFLHMFTSSETSNSDNIRQHGHLIGSQMMQFTLFNVEPLSLVCCGHATSLTACKIRFMGVVFIVSHRAGRE